jgi:predicted amidophosphoribosyltransferase
MNELIHEIENKTDFYSQPVLSDVQKPKEEFKNSHLGGDNIKYCQECGAKAATDDKFCTTCGAKFEVELKCSKCGSSVNEGDSFCMNCGNKI